MAVDDGKALPLVGRPGRESKEQGVTAPNQGPGRVALAKTFPIANCPGSDHRQVWSRRQQSVGCQIVVKRGN